VLALLPPLADGEAQTRALLRLSRYLPKTLKQQVAATVHLPDITESSALPGALAAPEIEGQVPSPPDWWNDYKRKTLRKLWFKMTQLSWQARLGGSRQAVATVRAMTNSWEQPEMLISLIPHLSPAGLEEALAVIQGLDDPRWRVEALAEAIVKLPEDRRSEIVRQIVAATGNISHTNWLDFELWPVANRLAQLGYSREALTLMQMSGRGERRNQALVQLAVYLVQAGYLAEALEAVRGIWGERSQGQALVKLGSYLTGPQWPAVLDEVLRLNEAQFRLQTLEQLAPHLAKRPLNELYPLWNELLRRVASRTRPSLLASLPALAPVLVALGGPEAVAEQALLIVEVGEWFP
jgi:hypothetical protein